MDVTQYNRNAWDGVAEKGDKLYRAVTPAEIESAKSGHWKIRVTPVKEVPKDWMLSEGSIEGQKVLCLAAGGGQQAPLFAAAGAEVTVFDVSAQQLARDHEIAKRSGLSIRTVRGDMADLGALSDDAFDLIVNPCSVIFCEDVQPIWEEAFRVLKPGGRFITGFINPLWYVFDAAKMDKGKLKTRHKIPYSDLQLSDTERARLIGPERPLEFGHTLADLIGGQLESGFEMVGFYEDRWGDEDSLSQLIDVFMATCCRKPKN